MDIPRYWRLRQQRYHLEGSQCEQCGKLFFPPRSVCVGCRSRQMKAYRLKANGKIYSYTIVYQTSERFEQQLPYVVALIDLEEGPRITAQLADIQPTEVDIGMEVQMIIRKIYEEGERGPIVYGYKFRPAIAESQNV